MFQHVQRYNVTVQELGLDQFTPQPPGLTVESLKNVGVRTRIKR